MVTLTTYSKVAIDKRLHITSGSDLVLPSLGNSFIQVHETITGSSGRQIHHLSFTYDYEDKEFQCTFMCPKGTDPDNDYTTLYFDGIYEIRAVNNSSNYTRIYLYYSGSMVTLGSGSYTISNVRCNSYTAHT